MRTVGASAWVATPAVTSTPPIAPPTGKFGDFCFVCGHILIRINVLDVYRVSARCPTLLVISMLLQWPGYVQMTTVVHPGCFSAVRCARSVCQASRHVGLAIHLIHLLGH